VSIAGFVLVGLIVLVLFLMLLILIVVIRATPR
jgi:hypothetical protein